MGLKRSVKGLINGRPLGIISVTEFGAKGDGVTDDTAAIQTALNSVPDGSTLYFPPGTVYKCTNLTFTKSNLKISGYGATLLSAMPVNNAKDIQNKNYTLLGSVAPKIKDSVVPSADIPAGSDTITIPDTSGVQPGDLVLIQTTKSDPLSSTYKLGSLRKVKSVSGNTITLDSGVENALSVVPDNVTVTIYRPINNITIEGLTIQLVKDSWQIGIWLDYTSNVTIRDCKFIGGGQNLIGVWVMAGFNVRINRVTCEEFLDDNLRWGYGVQVAGHDIQVTDSTFLKCKHGICGGLSTFVSTDILYARNYATDPQLAGIDAHGSCQRVKIFDNTVVDIGKSFNNATGIWARAKHFEISRNTVIGATVKGAGVTQSCGLKALESATENVVFMDNYIENLQYGIKTDEVLAETNNFKLMNNTIKGCDHGIWTGALNNAEIAGNIIRDTKARGISITGGDNLMIKDNHVEHASTAWGPGIYLDDFSARVCKNIKIQGNTIKPLSTNASNPIRVKKGYDRLDITNNVIDTDLHPTLTQTIKLDEALNLTTLVRENNVLDPEKNATAPPTKNFWVLGEKINNSSPVAGGTLGWICITAGIANNTAWQASRAYNVGDVVNANGKVYKCTVAGTSGTTAPSHTSGTATDGTVTWEYQAPLAVFKPFGSIST